jgi:hypothetical protein
MAAPPNTIPDPTPRNLSDRRRWFTQLWQVFVAALAVSGCSTSDSSSRQGVPMSDDELSREWRNEGLRYVAAMNDYLKRASEDSWDKAGEEPEDTRTRLAVAVIDAVRRANRDGTLQDLRVRFPPAHAPLMDLLKENGQSLPLVLLLDDGRILLRIGAPHEKGHVVMINDGEITSLADDIVTVGRSPNRRYFAVARTTGITVDDGWDGPRVAQFSWPTGREGAPDGFVPAAAEVPFVVSRLIPFPAGDRVLLVSVSGRPKETSKRRLKGDQLD